MKLLYFLLPAALWGLGYSTWPLATSANPHGFWWCMTNVLLAMAAVGAFCWAMFMNKYPDR